MIYRLRRHPIPMEARFRHSLVVTFAFPREVLDRLLPSGLTLDAYGPWGFVAVAVVEAERMRPAGLPERLGCDFLLASYRVFCRFRTPEGRSLRGLHILRSEAADRTMVVMGNLLTHYGYRHSAIRVDETAGQLAVTIRTAGGQADLDLVADLASAPFPLPVGSPFADPTHARRYAGPLPFTFDDEPETKSIVVIEGVRRAWRPEPVAVEIRRADFLRDPRFGGAEPVLATAFHVADVPYLWRRGKRYAR